MTPISYCDISGCQRDRADAQQLKRIKSIQIFVWEWTMHEALCCSSRSSFGSCVFFFSQILVSKCSSISHHPCRLQLSMNGMTSLLQWRSSLKYVIFDDFGTDEGVMRAPWCQRSNHMLSNNPCIQSIPQNHSATVSS